MRVTNDGVTDPTTVGPHRVKAELRALTGLRAVAALAVVFSHTGVPKDAPKAFAQVASWGHVGVPLFFMLSGFVLAYNYPDLSFRSRSRTVRFYIARIARVMPLYWAMILYCAAFYLALDYDQYPSALVQNLLAVQTWGSDLYTAHSRYNGPGWSVGVELFFYLLFPFLAPVVAALARRWGNRAMVAVVAMCAVIAAVLWAWFVLTGRAALPATNGESAHRWLYRNPLPHLVDFIAGMCLAYLWQSSLRLRVGAHHVIQAAVVVIVLFLAIARPGSNAFVAAGSFGPMFILPFAFLLFSLGSGKGWMAHLLATNVMVRLGTASYALYLTHRWFVWQLSTGRAVADTGVAAWVALIVTVCVLLVIAEGAHRYIEVPARRGILKVTRKRRSAPMPASTPKPAAELVS